MILLRRLSILFEVLKIDIQKKLGDKNINHIETKENAVPEELKEGINYLGSIKYKYQRDKVYANNDKDLQSQPNVIAYYK